MSDLLTQQVCQQLNNSDSDSTSLAEELLSGSTLNNLTNLTATETNCASDGGFESGAPNCNFREVHVGHEYTVHCIWTPVLSTDEKYWSDRNSGQAASP